MFANTLTLTIAGAPKVLTRINQDGYGSEYQFNGSADSIVMKIRHSTEKADATGFQMKRHNVYVERTIFATATTLKRVQSATVTLRGGSAESPTLAADLMAGVFVLLDAAMLTGLSIGDN